MDYFFDSNAVSNGTGTIFSPFNDLSVINTLSLDTSDAIYLKCNSIFTPLSMDKNAVKVSSLSPALVFTSYGNGNKPIITGGYKITPSSSTNNIYTLSVPYDSITGVGCVFSLDKQFIFLNDVVSYSNLTKNGDFYFNDGLLYLYSSESLDGKTLYATTSEVIFKFSSNMNISNINFMGSAIHGVRFGSGSVSVSDALSNVYFHDNEISFCGNGKNTDGKLGNGFELYNVYAENIVISNNIFYQCYDCGFTIQGGLDIASTNLIIKNNKFVNCSQAIEVGVFNYSATSNVNIEAYDNQIFLGNNLINNDDPENVFVPYLCYIWLGNKGHAIFHNNTIGGYKHYYLLNNTEPSKFNIYADKIVDIDLISTSTINNKYVSFQQCVDTYKLNLNTTPTNLNSDLNEYTVGCLTNTISNYIPSTNSIFSSKDWFVGAGNISPFFPGVSGWYEIMVLGDTNHEYWFGICFISIGSSSDAKTKINAISSSGITITYFNGQIFNTSSTTSDTFHMHIKLLL